MDPEYKARWVKALRSGAYEQGQEELRSVNDTFCCLGVLCDIVDPDAWDGSLHKGKDSYPTKEVLDIAGIPYESDNEGEVGKLVDFNDNQGYSFEKIADWIEENL